MTSKQLSQNCIMQLPNLRCTHPESGQTCRAGFGAQAQAVKTPEMGAVGLQAHTKCSPANSSSSETMQALYLQLITRSYRVFTPWHAHARAHMEKYIHYWQCSGPEVQYAHVPWPTHHSLCCMVDSHKSRVISSMVFPQLSAGSTHAHSQN
jgi:hypothetical protein